MTCNIWWINCQCVSLWQTLIKLFFNSAQILADLVLYALLVINLNVCCIWNLVRYEFVCLTPNSCLYNWFVHYTQLSNTKLESIRSRRLIWNQFNTHATNIAAVGHRCDEKQNVYENHIISYLYLNWLWPQSHRQFFIMPKGHSKAQEKFPRTESVSKIHC
jgi:hypothetical protein